MELHQFKIFYRDNNKKVLTLFSKVTCIDTLWGFNIIKPIWTLNLVQEH